MVGAALLAAAAVLVGVVVLLAATGRLRRNAIAGIRIPSLFTSDEAWRIGHRAAVLPTAGAAIVCVALAVLALGDRSAASLATPVETVVLVLGVLTGSVLAGRAARRHDRDP